MQHWRSSACRATTGSRRSSFGPWVLGSGVWGFWLKVSDVGLRSASGVLMCQVASFGQILCACTSCFYSALSGPAGSQAVFCNAATEGRLGLESLWFWVCGAGSAAGTKSENWWLSHYNISNMDRIMVILICRGFTAKIFRWDTGFRSLPVCEMSVSSSMRIAIANIEIFTSDFLYSCFIEIKAPVNILLCTFVN